MAGTINLFDYLLAGNLRKSFDIVQVGKLD
jgi:hypothetical protein